MAASGEAPVHPAIYNAPPSLENCTVKKQARMATSGMAFRASLLNWLHPASPLELQKQTPPSLPFSDLELVLRDDPPHKRGYAFDCDSSSSDVSDSNFELGSLSCNSSAIHARFSPLLSCSTLGLTPCPVALAVLSSYSFDASISLVAAHARLAPLGCLLSILAKGFLGASLTTLPCQKTP